MKILIVDDEVVINDFIRAALEELDIEVIQAFDGALAIDLMISQTFDAVILDLVMPNVDGFEVLEYLRLEEINVPVIVLSALSSDIDQLKGLRLGAYDYWIKPLSFALIQEKVKVFQKRIESTDEFVIFNDDRCEMKIENSVIKLTFLEYKMMRYLYVNKNKFCAKEKIADQLWEDWDDLRNVDYTVRRIRKKLNKYAYLIQTKTKVGYAYDETKN